MKWLVVVGLLSFLHAGCGSEAINGTAYRDSAALETASPPTLDGENWTAGTSASVRSRGAAEYPSTGENLDGRVPVDGTSSTTEIGEGRPERVVAQVDAAKADAAAADEPARADEPAVAERPAVEAAAKGKPGAVREAPQKNEPQSIARQIIYTATLQLVVRDFEKAREEIQTLLTQFDGYVAESNVGSRAGSVRTGRWVVRIPVSHYQPFLDSLGDVGIPENLTQKAQDVTQEFIDLTARIANQRHLEDRLVKLLEERSGDLKQAIEVERELARVRGEIETMQGRLRFLKNQTSLSTVTITVREEQNYVPPQAPSFGGRIAGVWFSSLRALQQFGEALVLVAVAMAPWLAILAVVVVAGRGLWKWRRAVTAVQGIESR